MRGTFHTELGEVITDLARMARLAGQMMTNAPTALHQTDLALAGLAIASRDQMNATCDTTEQRCITLTQLKHPNPVISDQIRPVLARMGLLASQLARGRRDRDRA